MSFPARSLCPSGASGSIVRHFSSSTSRSAKKGGGEVLSEAVQLARKKGERVVPINHIPSLLPFEFNDTTTLGYHRLIKLREAHLLVEKIVGNDAALKRHSKPFTPPTSPLRVSQIIDLTYPDDPVNHRRVLLVPVSELPLSSPESIHRFKLIAGPRWTPGRPRTSDELTGVAENRGYNAGPKDIGKEGWIKISEDRFPEGRMNRKSASDMLDKLIVAANDEKSPLSADIPLDPRHLIAKMYRQKGMLRQTHRRWEALKARPKAGGGIKGFPLEWLNEDVKKAAHELQEKRGVPPTSVEAAQPVTA